MHEYLEIQQISRSWIVKYAVREVSVSSVHSMKRVDHSQDAFDDEHSGPVNVRLFTGTLVFSEGVDGNLDGLGATQAVRK